AAGTVQYTAYNADGQKLVVDVEYTFVDGKTVKKGSNVSSVDTYAVTSASGGSLNGSYVKADKSEYDLKLTADGKADLYLTKLENDGKYYAVATKYTNIGDACGQLNEAKSGTYYEATYTDTNGDKQVEYYKASETYDGMYLLVDGKLVTVSATKLTTKVAHEWKAATYDKDDNVTTYKCKNCNTVATVYKTKDAAAASGAAVYAQGTDLGLTTSKWLAWTDGSTTTPSTDKGNTTSPKTFDAGIAMYVGMALTSVAGSAVVIGKKKEF
ncbi:MAG: hypothetical protein MR837_02065, partial [Firmicutes bacterium]|nr:hypothetical protein [Bacillota bacterium]